MSRSIRPRPPACLVTLVVALVVGCHGGPPPVARPSVVEAGLNPRDVIDLRAQTEADRVQDAVDLGRVAEGVRKQVVPGRNERVSDVLVLSGGGSYGAYSAGVLCGWTSRGDRPVFSVVTGISTGALLAPFAFLGPRYDAEVRRFYTTLESRDIFRIQFLRGLFHESFADNAPLARQVEQTVTPRMLQEIAAEHARGRRLYVGTTELESNRFVVWDLGAIASQNTPESLRLFHRVLLGSSAIPGFFPPSYIPVDVDGRCFVERHVDGGASQTLFFRAPLPPPGEVAPALSATRVWIVVAGKLFADPAVVQPRALSVAAHSVNAVLSAQTRGDLQRLYTLSLLTGMEYKLTAIPEDYRLTGASTEFSPTVMTAMFNEGARQAMDGSAWRTTPPGLGAGETALERRGTRLTYTPRGPVSPPPTAPAPPGAGVAPALPPETQWQPDR